jgi:hypothetical protein
VDPASAKSTVSTVWERRSSGEQVALECLRMMRRQGEAVITLLDQRGFLDVSATGG